jgi:hypothetical protein
VLEQYGRGVEGRNADIESGAVRPGDVILNDLIESTAALEVAWDATDWVGFGIRTLAGESPIDRLAFLRVREVSLHSVDLDIGIELDGATSRRELGVAHVARVVCLAWDEFGIVDPFANRVRVENER